VGETNNFWEKPKKIDKEIKKLDRRTWARMDFHTVGVTGSIPVAPPVFANAVSGDCPLRSLKGEAGLVAAFAMPGKPFFRKVSDSFDL